MKIGPFIISRTKKTAAGLVIYPWQALTEDRVAPELRQIVAKIARSEAKSHLSALTERLQEDERVRDFVKRELNRAESGVFAIDQQTLTQLYRLLDRLREVGSHQEGA